MRSHRSETVRAVTDLRQGWFLCLSLSVLLSLANTSYSGWEVSSSVVLVLDNVHLSDTPLRVQLHPHNTTGLVDHFIRSVGH